MALRLRAVAGAEGIDSELRLETDLNRLPQEIGAGIMIPSADDALRREVEGRGFFTIEGMPQVYLMERQFPDGVLCTCPHAFSSIADYSIPVGMAWRLEKCQKPTEIQKISYTTPTHPF